MNELQSQQANGNAALAITKPTINLPVINDPQEIMEAIETNFLDGENWRLDRIKVPGAGGLAFTVINDKNEEVGIATFKGVIIKAQNYCIRWLKDYDDLKEGEINPFCFSADRITGSGCPEMEIPKGQNCATCKFKQPDSDRRGGSGSDCHDRCAVFTLMENRAMPVNLDLPRTSLGNFRVFRTNLTNNQGKALSAIVTEFGLKTEVGKESGKKYSAVTFKPDENLQPAERAIIKQVSERWANHLFVDYNVMKQVAAMGSGEAGGVVGGGTSGVDINEMDFSRPTQAPQMAPTGTAGPDAF